MQDAFRGHIVVLRDQHTASDGEAFTAGFQQIKVDRGPSRRTRPTPTSHFRIRISLIA